MSRIFVAACVVFAKVASARKLVLAQDVDYPPYAYKDASTGELTGFGKDIADGMSAMCEDIEIEVVETEWSNCWSSSGGGTLGQLLENGTIDACMTYTHTEGVRDKYAEFSYGILKDNKAAGLLSVLENGKPKVTGHDDLAGKMVVDVGGWAPTADGLNFVENKCTGKKYSNEYTLLTGEGNDESMTMLLNGTADAMFVYADQAYRYQCKDGVEAAWNCDLWKGFGTKYAYVQTGQFGYVVNGTTLAMAKNGSGVAERLNPCLAKFMQTKQYYYLCVKYDLTASCHRNEFFPDIEEEKKEYDKPTNELEGDCSTGYCPCGEGNQGGDDPGLVSGSFSQIVSFLLALPFLILVV